MTSVFLVMHQSKDDPETIVKHAVSVLHAAGISVCTEAWVGELLGSEADSLFSGYTPDGCDAVLSLGGDGTFLRSVQTAVENDLPILGINIGHVGFLTESEMDSIADVCGQLRSGNYDLENRFLLQAELDERKELAFNDIVISRGQTSRVIDLHAYADDEHFGRYSGDGVVISTPSGSTGYSLSAGGPIVSPDVSCILVTPICPHSLQLRPAVFSSDKTITVALGDSFTAQVFLDGRTPFTLNQGQKLIISKADKYVTMICLHQTNFFRKIRIKLSEWSMG